MFGSKTSKVAAGDAVSARRSVRRTVSKGLLGAVGSTGSKSTTLVTGMLPVLRNDTVKSSSWPGAIVVTPEVDLVPLPMAGRGASTSVVAQSVAVEAPVPSALDDAETEAQLVRPAGPTSSIVTPVARPNRSSPAIAPTPMAALPSPSTPR